MSTSSAENAAAREHAEPSALMSRNQNRACPVHRKNVLPRSPPTSPIVPGRHNATVGLRRRWQPNSPDDSRLFDLHLPERTNPAEVIQIGLFKQPEAEQL